VYMILRLVRTNGGSRPAVGHLEAPNKPLGKMHSGLEACGQANRFNTGSGAGIHPREKSKRFKGLPSVEVLIGLRGSSA
jgi:hypothetical protein